MHSTHRYFLITQGGSEAKHSNELLHRIISEAVEAVAPEVGPGLVSLINTREEIRDLLKLDDVIDLVCFPAPGLCLSSTCMFSIGFGFYYKSEGRS